MSKVNGKIHNHPKMEKELGVDEKHVIIDKDVYFELLEKQHKGEEIFINYEI